MYQVWRIILGLMIALGLSVVSSYPPTLPIHIFTAYDYPVIRLLVLGGIFYGSLVVPDLVIPIAIVYAILSDDIVKTHSRKSSEEQFQSYPLINLLPGTSEVQEAKEFSEKHVSIGTIQNTIQQLEAQIADLSRMKK